MSEKFEYFSRLHVERLIGRRTNKVTNTGIGFIHFLIGLISRVVDKFYIYTIIKKEFATRLATKSCVLWCCGKLI